MLPTLPPDAGLDVVLVRRKIDEMVRIVRVGLVAVENARNAKGRVPVALAFRPEGDLPVYERRAVVKLYRSPGEELLGLPADALLDRRGETRG